MKAKTMQGEVGFLRCAAAARYLSVSRRTLGEWMRTGRVAFSKLGPRCVLFARGDLDAAMKRSRTAAVGE